MSKHDGEIRAAGVASEKLEDLLGRSCDPVRGGPDRHVAMARFLSGDKGWRDAHKTLRGTFAGASFQKTGLNKGLDK